LQTGDIAAVISSALFGKAWQKDVLNAGISVRLIKENLILIAYNFPTPNILLFFAGVFGLRKVSPSRGFTNILFGLLVLFLLFAFRYTVPDRYAFFIPFYCIIAILTGVGFEVFILRNRHTVLAVISLILTLFAVAVYLAAPLIAEKVNFNIPAKRELSYCNNYKWFLQPWKGGYNGSAKFAREALSSVDSQAVIIADGTTVYPLWYVQTFEGIGRQVKVVSRHGSYMNPISFPAAENIEQLLANHTVYVVSPIQGYCPEFLLESYNFVPNGVIWKVAGHK